MKLAREVRFALTDRYESSISNSWSGWPSTNLAVPRFSLITAVEGEPDPRSGYICNIKLIDDLVRNVIENDVIPQFRPHQPVEQLLLVFFESCLDQWESKTGIDSSLVEIVEQTLVVTPQLKYSINKKDRPMVCLTQQFEFSASHRLHCPELSDEENHAMFGKCNNPHGHGHNYVVEVSVNSTVESNSSGINLPGLEAKVKQLVINRLDHKHLNHDVEHFANVNPSVENIAIAIWNWLDGQLDVGTLTNVRVYETPKTWADYNKPQFEL